MDVAEAWSKIGSSTKTDRLKSAVLNGLDVASGWCAPVAERWDAEADRRDKLRTPDNLKKLMAAQREYNSARGTARSARAQRRIAKQAHKRNPLAAPRRSARTADKAARQAARQAEAELTAARHQYPKRLVRRAVELHAAHVVPTVGSSVALTMWQDVLTVWPAGASAVAVAANVAAVRLGRRGARPLEINGDASAEERALLERLDPTYWVAHAPDRGLGGTVTGAPELGGAGITCAVRLDGQWDVGKLAGAESQVRALLGARTGLRMEIREGDRGGWAVLALRTRSAVDGASLLWTPEREGIGLDTATGEVVRVPHGRKIVAGTSGAGKSVLLRAILAPYVLDPLSAVIYIDAKGEESALWSHCAREAIDPEEIAQVVAELVAEMLARRDEMRRRKVATWTATEARPRLVVLVDEGADLILMDDKKTPIIDPLSQIARQGRSRLVDLIWCTQKPTVGEGIPSQIIGNMAVRVVLQTAGQTETQQVMGKGWQNHMLPGPGLAYLRGTGRQMDQAPVAVWDASDDRVVTSLPRRKPWREEASPDDRPALTLVKDGPAAEVPAPRPKLSDTETAVLAAVRELPAPVRQAHVVDRTGLAKGTVSKVVGRLVEAGHLAKDADGALVVPAGEVSA